MLFNTLCPSESDNNFLLHTLVSRPQPYRENLCREKFRENILHRTPNSFGEIVHMKDFDPELPHPVVYYQKSVLLF